MAAITSVFAYRAHRDSGLSASQRDSILRFIADKGGDWSIGELAAAMGLQKSTVSARLRELLDGGDLEEKPKRKDRESGIRVRPVGLPAQQLSLFH